MKAGIVGRLLRLLLGLYLVATVLPFWIDGSRSLRLGAAALFVLLAVVYVAIGLALRRRPQVRHSLLTSAAALVPLVALYALGIGGGPLLGAGEGQLAALSYLGLSLLVVAVSGERSCEVLALPQLVLGRRSELPCLVFHLPDRLEDRLAGRPRSGP